MGRLTALQARSLCQELQHNNDLLRKQVGELTAAEIGLLVRLVAFFVKEEDNGEESVPFDKIKEIPRLLAEHAH